MSLLSFKALTTSLRYHRLQKLVVPDPLGKRYGLPVYCQGRACVSEIDFESCPKFSVPGKSSIKRKSKIQKQPLPQSTIPACDPGDNGVGGKTAYLRPKGHPSAWRQTLSSRLNLSVQHGHKYPSNLWVKCLEMILFFPLHRTRLAALAGLKVRAGSTGSVDSISLKSSWSEPVQFREKKHPKKKLLGRWRKTGN